MDKKLRQDVKAALGILVENAEYNIPEEAVLEQMYGKCLGEDFKQRLDELIRKRKRYVFVFGRYISKVAILVLVLLLFCTTAYAVYRTKLLYKIFERNTNVSNEAYEMEAGNELIEEVYIPSLLDDYELIDNIILDNYSQQVFSGENGYITLIQQASIAQYNMDNEDVQAEEVIIHYSTGIQFVKNGEITIIWSEYGYLFELYAPEQVDLEVLVKIAESLQPNKALMK